MVYVFFNIIYSVIIIDLEGNIYVFDFVFFDCNGLGNEVIIGIGEVIVNIDDSFCVLVIVLDVVEVIGFEVGIVWLLGVFSYIGIVGGVFGDVVSFIIDDSNLDIG